MKYIKTQVQRVSKSTQLKPIVCTKLVLKTTLRYNTRITTSQSCMWTGVGGAAALPR